MSSVQNDKREFLRYRCDKPLHFKILLSPKDNSSASKLLSGISKNLSISGILFASNNCPDISSVLALDLDYRTTGICREIEENTLIIGNKLIGKVVRIEEKDGGAYNVGAAFIKKSDQISPEIIELLK